MNIVRPILVGVVVMNLVNALGNWIFVYGHLGMPAMGPVGSAYATVLARVALAIFLWVVIVRGERRRPSGFHDVPITLDTARMWRLVRLGTPAALQLALEFGVFAVAAALAGRISPVALAANQMVLNVASFFFMVPFGLSSAAAVRVGQAVGRDDPAAVRRAGWSALGLATVCAVVFAALFLSIPEVFIRIFTADPTVLAVGRTVMLVCAAVPTVRWVSDRCDRCASWPR